MSATLACVPYTWVAADSKASWGAEEAADLQRIAQLLPVDDRDVSRAASKWPA